MQIHELSRNSLTSEELAEGFWDTAGNIQRGVGQSMKSAGKAIANPMQAAKALTTPNNGDSLGNRIDSQKKNDQIRKFSDRAYDTWTKFVRQRLGTFSTPAEKKTYFSSTGYKDDLIKFLEKNFYRGENLPPETLPLLNKLAQTARVKYRKNIVAEAPTLQGIKQGAQQGVTGAKNLVNKVTPYVQKGIAGAQQQLKNVATQTDQADRAIFQKLIQLAVLHNQQTSSPKQSLNSSIVKITSLNPPTAQYLGKEWIELNGSWADAKTQKPADEAIAARLTARYEAQENLAQNAPTTTPKANNSRLSNAIDLVKKSGYNVTK